MHRRRGTLAVGVLVYLTACGPKAVEPVEANLSAEVDGALTLLHTNDIHCHFQPTRADWLDGTPEIGGFSALDGYTRRVRNEKGAENVLLLDGGDLLSGTPLTEFETRGIAGGAMLDFIEAAGYDAWVVGNHEFDKGFANTRKMIEDSRVPVLSANLDGPNGGPASPSLLDHIVVEIGELNVGIIGVTTERLSGLASEDTMAQLNVRPVVDTVANEVATLDPATDLLIVVSHIGLPADRALAQQVNGIDLIVGGHSHTYMDEPERVNGVWIVQAGSYLRSVGQVELTVANDTIRSFEAELVDLSEAGLADEAGDEMKELVQRWQSELDATYGAEIGAAEEALTRDYNHDSSLGGWITDALRAWAKTDVAVYNGGGLRANVNSGPLEVLDLYQVFPFGNAVVTFEVTGQELMGLALQNAWAEHTERRAFTQISGMETRWHVERSAPELLSMTIDGKPLDPAATYSVATNSFVADQAARYLGFAAPTYKDTGKKVLDVAVEVAKQGPIVAPTDERSVQVQR